MAAEMVERVARAISSPEIWDEALLRFYGDMWMYAEQSKARARAVRAIEAMREPTPAMVEAGEAADVVSFSLEPGEGLDSVNVDEAWRAMIDEALK